MYLLLPVSVNFRGLFTELLLTAGGRTGEVKRVTKETNVYVKINLDGNAEAENDTGIPFLDHMLDVSFIPSFFQNYFLLMASGLNYLENDAN